MKAIDFPQRNLMLAEEQAQYETLPVFVEMKVIDVPTAYKDRFNKPITKEKAVPWLMTACFELTDAEIEEMTKTRKLWYRQLVFGNNFQPVFMNTRNPFEDVSNG